MKKSSDAAGTPFSGWNLRYATEVPNAAVDRLLDNGASLVEWRLWLTLHRRCAAAGEPVFHGSVRDLARLAGTGRRNVVAATRRLVAFELLEYRSGVYRVIPAVVGQRGLRPAPARGSIEEYLGGYMPPLTPVEGDPCPYCGVAGLPMITDHIQSRAHGGQDTPDNLVYVCAPCNAAKRDRSLLAFIAEAGLP